MQYSRNLKNQFFLLLLESEKAVVSLDLNRPLNIQLNDQLNHLGKLTISELNKKNVRPVFEDFEQCVEISENVLQDQTENLKEKTFSPENVKQDIIIHNSLSIDINESCLSTSKYQKVELTTQNVKTDFITATAAEITETVVSFKTKDFADEIKETFEADKEIVLQQSKNVKEVISNVKENEMKKESIKKEQIEYSLIEHYSIDCKQNTSLASEKRMEPIKKPNQFSAMKSFETTNNSIVVEQVYTRENESEHKTKKKKKNQAMPRISTQEAIIIRSTEPSVKEYDIDIEKITPSKAKKTIKPQKAIQVIKVDHFDLESEKKKDLIKTDLAKQEFPLQDAFQVNEIISSTNVGKFKTAELECSEAKINLLEKRTFANIDQTCLEKENCLKIEKDLNQYVNQKLIPQEQISVNQIKYLENINDLNEVKKEYQNAKFNLSDQTIANINRNQLMDKEKDFNIDETKKKKASSFRQPNKVRSISVERPQLLEKEKSFEKIRLDMEKANLELTVNKAKSNSEILALENEKIYEEIRLKSSEASPKIDLQMPMEILIVMSNEKDTEFKIEDVVKKQPEMKQEAINLVAADSMCVQSEFMHSAKTGNF